MRPRFYWDLKQSDIWSSAQVIICHKKAAQTQSEKLYEFNPCDQSIICHLILYKQKFRWIPDCTSVDTYWSLIDANFPDCASRPRVQCSLWHYIISHFHKLVTVGHCYDRWCSLAFTEREVLQISCLMKSLQKPLFILARTGSCSNYSPSSRHHCW